MKWIWISLMLLMFTSTFAQVNLVQNSSFEDTVACPVFANQVDRAVSWHSSFGSPDYFNECDWLTGTAGVPYNFAGYQYAHSGNAYCGSILYDKNDPNYRECFTSPLISPLKTGRKYLISLYVSWAGTFTNRLACNKIGTFFSTNNFNTSSPIPISNYCQFYSDSIIVDSLDWVLLSGSFISDSNYTYITIGGFYDDSHTDTLQLSPSAHAYYYIDDIELLEDTMTALIENFVSQEIKIYPNPLNDRIKIVSISKEIISLQILNPNGEILLNKTIENQAKEIDLILADLKSGLYYLKINFKNTNSLFYKILKL